MVVEKRWKKGCASERVAGKLTPVSRAGDDDDDDDASGGGDGGSYVLYEDKRLSQPNQWT